MSRDPTFPNFPKLPRELRETIWKLHLDCREGRLGEFFIECVPRLKDQETGLYRPDPNAIVVDGDTENQLQRVIRFRTPGVPIPSILHACTESRAIATKIYRDIDICPVFDEERDKVIVMDTKLGRSPPGWVPAPGMGPSSLPQLQELLDTSFNHFPKEALRSLKHIAVFVLEPLRDMVDGVWYHLSLVQLRFPKVETITVISREIIDPQLWSASVKELYKPNTRLDLSSVNLLVPHNGYLFKCWKELNKTEFCIEEKIKWDSEMRRLLREPTTTQAEREKWVQFANKEREAARSHLRGQLRNIGGGSSIGVRRSDRSLGKSTRSTSWVGN